MVSRNHGRVSTLRYGQDYTGEWIAFGSTITVSHGEFGSKSAQLRRGADPELLARRMLNELIAEFRRGKQRSALDLDEQNPGTVDGR